MSQKKRPPTKRVGTPRKPSTRKKNTPREAQFEPSPAEMLPDEPIRAEPIAYAPPASVGSAHMDEPADDFSAGILGQFEPAPPARRTSVAVLPPPREKPAYIPPAPKERADRDRFHGPIEESPAPDFIHDEPASEPAVSLEEETDRAEIPVMDNGDTAERAAAPAGQQDRPPRSGRRRGRRGRSRRGNRESDDVIAPAPAVAESPIDVGDSPEPAVEEELEEAPLFGTPDFDEIESEPDDDERAAPARRGAVRSEPAEDDGPQREMLINVTDGDECRIAVLTDGKLDELYMERATAVSNVGNIYKGRVTNVERSIQAAFIDFGLPVQGFLHISDLHPKYFSESRSETEQVGRKTPRRQRPPIQNCLRRGQEVIVQVIKEGIGTKGPTLSSYISLPGRFLVMMPGMDQLGVSRKIEDEETRRKLREALGQLELPKDMGFIVRTAGIDRTKRDLQRDLNYLARLWGKVAARIAKIPAPAELYKESDLVIRTIRDVYDSNLKRIVVDEASVAQRVREFLAIASPRGQDVVELYEGTDPLFHRHGIEQEIDKLHSKHVPLVCGGSLVIEQTEALVAIDVNSGRFRVPDNPEETSYRVNCEAADEIARQLRLRDLGGLIICDFIDMMHESHRRSIERRLAEALKKHKERAKLLRISRFGILEMTRQRQRPSFAKSMFRDCPRCGGSGHIKAPESVCLDVMRQIRMMAHKENVASIDVYCSSAVANELQNRKRHQLTDLERERGETIRIHAESAYATDEVRLTATDRRGREIQSGTMAPEPTMPSARGSAPGASPSQVGPPRPGGRSGGGRRRRRR